MIRRLAVLVMIFVAGHALSCFGLAADEPLLRIAILSDIQGYAYREDVGARNLERALKLYRPLRPDVILNDGDINDHGRDLDFVRWYRRRCEETLGPVPHVACVGNHELGFVPNELRSTRSYESIRREFNSIFGYEAEAKVIHLEIRGFDFFAIHLDNEKEYGTDAVEELERGLVAASRRDPSKSIFVVSHYHPYDTVFCSTYDDRDRRLRNLLNRFPQVVNISGHTHTPLQDPRSIWQGEFTVIETGSLSYGCLFFKPQSVNQITDLIPYGHDAVGCSFAEVYADRLVLRRYTLSDGTEIAPENPLVMPLPHDPSHPKYGIKERTATETPPEFPANVEPAVWFDYGFVYLLFDPAIDTSSVFGYNVAITDDNGVCRDYFHLSDYYRPFAHRANRVCFRFPPNSVMSGRKYRLEVRPVGFFGSRGRAFDMDVHIRDGYPCNNTIPVLPVE